MGQEKEKPAVETVQQAVKVSDLLMYEVCTPLKEQIDRVKLCKPSIIDCTPNEICKPVYTICSPSMFCTPMRFCVPLIAKICAPDLPQICSPSAGMPIDPGELVMSANVLKQRLLASDFEQLQADIARLKAEVEALRKK